MTYHSLQTEDRCRHFYVDTGKGPPVILLHCSSGSRVTSVVLSMGGAQQPIPELVEVVRKISLEVRNRLPVYASRPLVGLHTLEGLP